MKKYFSFLLLITILDLMDVYASYAADLNKDLILKAPQISEHATDTDESENFLKDSSSGDQENQSELVPLYQTKKLFSDPSTAQVSLDYLQSAPPTKHPIERKTEKALLLPFIIPVSALGGIGIGVAIASCTQLAIIPAFIVTLAAAVIAIGLGIHYGWNFVNMRFKD